MSFTCKWKLQLMMNIFQPSNFLQKSVQPNAERHLSDLGAPLNVAALGKLRFPAANLPLLLS